MSVVQQVINDLSRVKGVDATLGGPDAKKKNEALKKAANDLKASGIALSVAAQEVVDAVMERVNSRGRIATHMDVVNEDVTTLLEELEKMVPEEDPGVPGGRRRRGKKTRKSRKSKKTRRYSRRR
jgi:GTP cyclohydrolase III